MSHDVHRRGRGGRNPQAKVRRQSGAHTNDRGAPKTGYLTEFRATEAAAERTAETGRPMMPYRCTTCGLWHIGAGRAL